MNYKQQSSQPEWYNQNPDSIYLSATSGNSPFNEWYEFENREEAIRFINERFHSQAFHDKFVSYEGDYYDLEDCDHNDNEDFCPRKDSHAVDLNDIIHAESKF